ncbi:MAG: hypothetical protein NTZ16_05590 [Verrucomicrobia bacterium]|nr:hypothetical protein [Verrucomicrobiota bacterium]
MKTTKSNNFLPREMFSRRLDPEGLAMAGLFAAFIGMCACCLIINRPNASSAKTKPAPPTNAVATTHPPAPTNIAPSTPPKTS